MSAKRIRSSYHKRVLEWLIDTGGSVSDIAQALDLRMPHASLALRQLRESGDVARDDHTGIRGAIHRITEQGRRRLEQDAVACLQTYVDKIPTNRDAIILDSNGPMLLLGYVNDMPPTLIPLPFDPMDYDGQGNLLSIGNVGVRWATIRNIQPKWYDINTFEQVQKQELQSTGTLVDWTEKRQYIIIVRAYLFDFEKQWNIAPGTWFSTPKNASPLPVKLSSGDNILGTIVDSEFLISPSVGIHAHLSSSVDVSLAINALSKGAFVIREDPVKSDNRFLPIGCLEHWIKQQHPRMKEKKSGELLVMLKNHLLGNTELIPPISIQRSLIRDFGECRWTNEINYNIDIKGFSERGTVSLIEWLLSINTYEFIVEWIWPISSNRELLERVMSSNICRMLVTRSGEIFNLPTSTLQLKSLSKLAQVELVISREQSVTLELSRHDREFFSYNVYDVVPTNALELQKSLTGNGWDLGVMTDDSKEYHFREKIWKALERFPTGDESWANRIEADYPLAAWIATPVEQRISRWIRISNLVPKGWVDLLPIEDTTTKDLLVSLPNAAEGWQNGALEEIHNRYLSNQELLLEHEDLLQNPAINSWFSVSVLLCSNRLGKDFNPLIKSCIEVWLDTPRKASKVLSNLFPKTGEISNSMKENLTTCLKASKVHPKDSLLYCWGQFVECLQDNKPISMEESRKVMSLLPVEWWLKQGNNWLQLQLNSTSGRRWLSETYFPWPAIIARAEGEKCGPPGYRESFSQNLPKSDDLLHILILSEGIGKSPLLDLYDMIFSLEQKQKLPVGRIHPLVGWLVRDSKEWPDFGIEVLKLGDLEVGLLLFVRYYHECLLEK